MNVAKDKTWLIMDSRASDALPESFDAASVIESLSSKDGCHTNAQAVAYLKRKHDGYGYCLVRWDEGEEPELVASLLTDFGCEAEREEAEDANDTPSDADAVA